MASRVLGVLREVALSHYFGAGPLLSAFRVAFQLPNLARRLFGEGALTSSFIPVFTRVRDAHGDLEARRLSGSVFTLLTVVLTALLVLVELGLLITSAFVWGPTLSLTALLMPYMVLICLTAFFGGVLNGLNRFAAPAIAPMILNIVLIVATVAGAGALKDRPLAHLTLISVAVLLAGGLQVAVQVLWLRACSFTIRINLNWSSPHVRRILLLMGPMVVGLSAVQLNTFADSLIALFMVKDGRGPAILGFAQFISHLPLGVFGIALATAIFPMLAQRVAEKDAAGFVQGVEMGLRTSSFIAIPSAVGLIAVAAPTVRVLFEHGEFDVADTPRVVASLIYYSLGLWAYSIQQILVRAFYSMEDSRTPIRIAMVILVLNVTLNIVLVSTPLREGGVALATAVTAFIQTFWLAIKLSARLDLLRWKQTIRTILQCLLGSGLMFAVVWVLRGQTPLGKVLPGGDVVELTVSIIAGSLAYLGMARLFRMEELSVILRTK